MGDANELWNRGVRALVAALGPEDAAAFLQTLTGSAPDLSTFIRESEVSPAPAVAQHAAAQSPPPPAMVTSGAPAPQPAERQRLLPFAEPVIQDDAQPWGTQKQEIPTSEEDKEREKLYADLEQKRIATIFQKVAQVLQTFPETRDSATALTTRYWLKFQAQVLESNGIQDLDFLYRLDNIETLARARRHIQHDLKMFRGLPENQSTRERFQRELFQVLAAQRTGVPEVHIYLDETSTDKTNNYVGIGGVVILNSNQYRIHYAALRQWREFRGWPETIHFADLDNKTIPRAVELLTELQTRRGGLLFFAYRIREREATDNTIANLIRLLVVDALKHAEDNGCLDSQRGIRIIKEAEASFDTFRLPSLEKELSAQLAQEFPDRAYLAGITSKPKGCEVLLEAADLIAASTRRRDLYATRKPKDRLAEAVMNLTKFEQPSAEGVLFRMFPLGSKRPGGPG